MKTISFTGYAYAKPAGSYNNKDNNCFNGICYDIYGFKNNSAIAEVEVTFKLPEGFDPVEKAVKELEKQREELRANFQMAVNEINDQIGRMTALTNEVDA